ncbi:MAG TPA: phosphopantothenoylcysteine decarboxylase [Verrucomicrobiae bacterium]|nr:phosphopantothenoylcysteine decarboxylase [Verrucomicrobiae bacterium]
MNCIVTAGPTFEPLDDVRRLTNFSTGRLGTELANYLAARGHSVMLLLGEQATYTGERRAKRVEFFSTTADLRAKLKALSARKADAIFHAAAVSDFSFGRVFACQSAFDPSRIAPSTQPSPPMGEKVSAGRMRGKSGRSGGDSVIADAANKLAEIKGRKISTRQGKLLVELLPTPKIIAELRGWFPRAKIVGWKFEADGKRADAIAAARRQLAECVTDLCVVNGPAYGEGFGLLGRKGEPAHLPNPPVLFDALEKFVR